MKKNNHYILLKFESKSGFMKEKLYKYSKKSIVSIFNLVRKKNRSVFYAKEDVVEKAKNGDFDSIEKCLQYGGKYETTNGYKTYWDIVEINT